MIRSDLIGLIILWQQAQGTYIQWSTETEVRYVYVIAKYTKINTTVLYVIITKSIIKSIIIIMLP